KKRGITNINLLEKFRVGFCNGTLKKIIPTDGNIFEQLKETGIFQENNRESFENCVVFPIIGETGAIESLYGRKIEESAQNDIAHLYLAGSRNGLINGEALKTGKHIILTESIIDALSLYQAEIKHAVPCYGVNGFTEYHSEQLKKNKITDITILFDNDESGRNGAKKIKEKISSYHFSCEIKELSKEKDINEFLIKHGEEEIFSFLAVKKNDSEQGGIACSSGKVLKVSSENSLLLKYGDRKYIIKGIENSSTKLRASIKAQNCTRFHIDTFDLYSAKARREFIKESSFLFKQEPQVIEEDIMKLITDLEAHIQNKAPVETVNDSMNDKDRKEALNFGKHKNLIEEIIKDIERLGYIGEEANKIFFYIAMTSRKMPNPISVMVLSASGGGKSTLQDTVLELCPEEELVKLTSLSERALFYKEKEALKHKVLALAEEAGAESAGYAIRNLISSKELIIESTIKDNLTGRITTMTNKVEGPTAVFKTTTNPFTDAETRSRFVILTVDESKEQTERILDYQRAMQTLEGFIFYQKRYCIIRKHRNFQKLLRKIPVFNPYAKLLTYNSDKLRVRRDNPKYLQLINAIAFLHQLQRPLKQKEGIEYIEVTLEDIAFANELGNKILKRSLDELSAQARKLLEIMKELKLRRKEEKGIFTRRELREASGWGESYIRVIIRELLNMDYLIPVKGGLRKTFQYEFIENNNESVENNLININELKEKVKNG
ncbi:MAG: DnaG primase-like protein, partial [uncultured bacterium]